METQASLTANNCRPPSTQRDTHPRSYRTYPHLRFPPVFLSAVSPPFHTNCTCNYSLSVSKCVETPKIFLNTHYRKYKYLRNTFIKMNPSGGCIPRTQLILFSTITSPVDFISFQKRRQPCIILPPPRKKGRNKKNLTWLVTSSISIAPCVGPIHLHRFISPPPEFI